MKRVTREQIDSLLPFLDRFEAANLTAGTWDFEPGKIPVFEYDEVAREILQVLYDNDWITPDFDWTKWQYTANEYVESPAKIESADAETIQKLFTTHIRKDRFCEGHLAAMLSNGHIFASLRRLKVIREAMGRNSKDE